jgi:hypothetical protein
MRFLLAAVCLMGCVVSAWAEGMPRCADPWLLWTNTSGWTVGKKTKLIEQRFSEWKLMAAFPDYEACEAGVQNLYNNRVPDVTNFKPRPPIGKGSESTTTAKQELFGPLVGGIMGEKMTMMDGALYKTTWQCFPASLSQAGLPDMRW